MQGKELPHDLLAEKSLLSCLLIDGSSFDEVAHVSLTAEDFYHPQYAIVFDSINDLATSSKPIDLVTVCSKLNDRGKLEKVGGQTFLTELLEDQASSVNAGYYAKSVKEKSGLRQIIRMGETIAQRGKSFQGEMSEFFSNVEADLFKITMESKTGGMIRIKACLKENLKELSDDSRTVGEISGIPTGYKKLDELLLGLQPGQLIILAARPAMGKSALALNLATNCVFNTGLPVAFFSLEMLAHELSLRILCSRAKVDSKRLKTKNYTDTDLRSISHAVGELSELPIFINDSGGTTVFDIQSQCRKIKSESGLGMVVIDYLQLLRPGNGHIPREQQISEMSRGLKNLAKELECPVIALSQLNRGVESRTDKRPMVSDLRESGSIEQDADIVMLLYRDEVYNPDTQERGVAEVIVGKNRAGEIGTAKLKWMGQFTSFEELSYIDSNAPQE